MTASVPRIIKITQQADFTARFTTDIPVNVITDVERFADQFEFESPIGPIFGDLSNEISSRSFFVSWSGLFATVSNVIYTPDIEPITSRLGTPMAPFDLPVPFP